MNISAARASLDVIFAPEWRPLQIFARRRRVGNRRASTLATVAVSSKGEHDERSPQFGRFLDQQFAISIFVVQQEGGYYVEYASVPSGQYTASKLVRVGRLMDDAALNRLRATGTLGE